MGFTEDTINDLVSQYLRDMFKNPVIDILRETTVSVYKKTYKADFRIVHGDKIIFGEGEWEKSIVKGLDQAYTYLESQQASASFTLIYNNVLENMAKDSQTQDDLRKALEKGRFQIYYRWKGMPASHVRCSWSELPNRLEELIHDELHTIDAAEFIEVIHQCSNALFPILPELNENSMDLYQHILGSDEELKKDTTVGLKRIMKNTSGYLFLNQLIFYSILSFHRDDLDQINVKSLSSLSDLNEYFEKVLDIDFKPIFSINVITYAKNDRRSINIIKSIISAIQYLGPEYIENDVIGRIFHKLIPKDIRKKVAAYYTKPESAKLLAHLVIKNYNVKIIDPACGSGQLLIAAYLAMQKIYEKSTNMPLSKEMHKEFLEEQITGIDIMPFSAHLSLINLTLQNIYYFVDKPRIAIEDSTKIYVGKMIRPLEGVLQTVQAKLLLWEKGKSLKKKKKVRKSKKIEKGSIGLEREGESFKVERQDIVLMNPPFTRQELIDKLGGTKSSGFKARVRENIAYGNESLLKYMNGRQSLSSYFILLADKLLKRGGIIASVLPATILRDDVNQKLREYLIANFKIVNIIIRYDALNFSDDTTFREILLVVEKTRPGRNHKTSFIVIKEFVNNIELQISQALSSVKGQKIHVFDHFNIQNQYQRSLHASNLFAPLALRHSYLQNVWHDISLVDKFYSPDNSGKTVIAREGRGSRMHGLLPEMTIVTKMDSKTKMQFDKMVEGKETRIYFTSIGGVEHNCLKEDLVNYTRSGDHRKMNLNSLNDFAIRNVGSNEYLKEINPPIYQIYKITKKYTKSYFSAEGLKPPKSLEDIENDYPEFYEELRKLDKRGKNLSDKESLNIGKKIINNSFEGFITDWENYLDSGLCYLGTIETLHIEAPNTYFFAYFSGNEKRIFSTIYNNLISLDKISAQINCLWLNSSLNFLQLFVQRVPTGWFKIRQYVVESLKLLDVQKLSKAEIEDCLNVFNEICNIEMPCIWKQILFSFSERDKKRVNVEEIVSDFSSTRNPLDPQEIKKILSTSFPHRREMDSVILKLLLPDVSKIKIQKMLDKVYPLLFEEIKIMKRLQSNI